jgi:hypothetical protein
MDDVVNNKINSHKELLWPFFFATNAFCRQISIALFVCFVAKKNLFELVRSSAVKD